MMILLDFVFLMISFAAAFFSFFGAFGVRCSSAPW
jgi:hypothetical protein